MTGTRRGQPGVFAAVRLLAVAVLALGMFLTPWTATRAYACSCVVGLPVENFVNRADVILVGTAGVRYVGPNAYGEPLGDGWRTVYFSQASSQPFQVEMYLKGMDNATVTVYGGSPTSDCSFAGEAGKRYLLFLYKQGDKHETGLCSGNAVLDTPLGRARLREVQAITGPGRLPEDTAVQSRLGMPVAAVGLVGLAAAAAWVRERRAG